MHLPPERGVQDGCSCPETNPLKSKRPAYSLLGSLVLLLLPKCHFCLLAYSNAVVLCSGRVLYDHQPGWSSWVSISIAIVTIVLLLWHWQNTWSIYVAILLAIIGTILIIQSELYTGALNTYMFGAVLIMTASLLRSKFFSIFSKWLMIRSIN